MTGIFCLRHEHATTDTHLSISILMTSLTNALDELGLAVCQHHNLLGVNTQALQAMDRISSG